MKNFFIKRGFTIAELILTTIIMAIICVIAPVIILKRNVKPAVAKKFEFIAQCDTSSNCIFDAATARLKVGSNTSFNEARLDYNKNSNDFYVIELVGGGGGGSNISFGFPGETKTIFIPALTNNEPISGSNADPDKFAGILTGYYLLDIGAGGAQGATGSSGADTKFCVISKADAVSKAASSLNCNNNGITTIATAKGGISSGENVPNGEPLPPTQYGDYGKGGIKNGEGSRGLIVIR